MVLVCQLQGSDPSHSLGIGDQAPVDPRGVGFEASRAQSAAAVGMSQRLHIFFGREVGCPVKRQEVAVREGGVCGSVCVCVCVCGHTRAVVVAPSLLFFKKSEGFSNSPRMRSPPLRAS